MSKTIIVKSPFAGYEVVDYAAGRVLERYGQVLVDCPIMDQTVLGTSESEKTVDLYPESVS